MLMEGPQVPFARDKNGCFTKQELPPSPKGMEILIQMPDLGGMGYGTSGEQTLYYSFLVLTMWV